MGLGVESWGFRELGFEGFGVLVEILLSPHSPTPPFPHTPHPTPYTPHPTPHTPHPTPHCPISLTAFPSIPSDFKTDQEATAATIELAETSFSTTETAIDSLDNLAGTFDPFIDIVG